ncbi:MAG: C4-dicarboxylate transporter DctA [Chitinophagaceae bacterium]|nr:C4-dicarboxylate transporter DctA [Chitinophagaceae bacterium]MCA6469057.1 C4-dicarboxylate transporter DctA [Chitinophagaceae bacterium]MCA6478874.1 C4-dicarboxylate transporter DctA [Chitinophagaceae bacterium]MCA6479764.1 C4-dicarboxylate transporter DctA [Chitinophagaceae bacterium]MCA6485025.1 C4-dicarboxylate transporter DctA [Chitinophagaceae bacterium]
MKKILSNLTFWVLLSISAGILLGHFRPALAVQMKPLGDYFIDVVKLFIGPIIFLTLVTGISGMGDLKKVGKLGAKALIYFEVITTLALIIGMLVGFIFRPGAGVTSNASTVDISKYRSGDTSISWIDFFKSNYTIQILLVAILVGIIVSRLSRREEILRYFYIASSWVFRALHWVMKLAPIGAFGGMAYTIGKYGIASLLPLGKLMLCVYLTMALFLFVVLGSLLRYYSISMWKFLSYIKNELLIVLGTSSSEAGLPSLMEKLEGMGCHKSVVGLVVPAGYSFNLDGTSIYLSMAIIFLAQVYDVHLNFSQIITIIGILMVTSKGAAGVTGSGFIILASTLTATKVIPIEGLALLLGVDRFMSEARAITNFIGNGVAAIVLSNHEKMFDKGRMHEAFHRKGPNRVDIPAAE